MFVCLSVCPSVCHTLALSQGCVGSRNLHADSPRTLVFRIKISCRNSKGFTPARAFNENGGGKIRAVSQKRCEIAPKLLLITNRKAHTPFRLVLKSTILDDFERPIRTMLQKRRVFRAHHKNLNEDRAAKIYANDSTFWQYRVCADIRGGYTWRGGIRRQ